MPGNNIQFSFMTYFFLQTTLAVHSLAKTRVCVYPRELMLMNVTVPGQDIMVKTALPVSSTMGFFRLMKTLHSTQNIFFLPLQLSFSHVSNQL